MNTRTPKGLVALAAVAALAVAGCDQGSTVSTNLEEPLGGPSQAAGTDGQTADQPPTAEAQLPELAAPVDLAARDAVVHLGVFGASHDGRYFANHPIEVKLGVRMGRQSRSDLAIVGFVERDPSQPAVTPEGPESSCVVGTFEIPGEGEAPAGETVSFQERFVLPPSCLGGDESRELDAWVWLADMEEIAEHGILQDTTICNAETGECQGEPSVEEVYVEDGEPLPNRLEQANLVVLNDGHLLDERNQLCVGADGERGCVSHVRAAPSPGLDVVFGEVSNVSSVAVNWSVFDEIDPAEKVTAPLFNVSSRLLLYGAQLDEPETDPLTGLREVDTDTVLPAPVVMTYDLCPSDLGAECGDGGWQPLLVQQQGQGVPVLTDGVEVEALTALSPRTLYHDLYPADSTRELLGPDGAWRQAKQFTIRACAVPTEGLEEAGLDADPQANNCSLTDVVMVEPPAEYAEALGKSWGGSYDKDGGGWVLSFKFRSGHVDTVDTSGLHTRTWANANLKAFGGAVDYTLFDLKHNADAYITIMNSGMDYYFELFEKTYASYYNRLEEYADPNEGKGASCKSNADCGWGNFPVCMDYDKYGLGKCKRPCSDASVCRYGEACYAGECQYIGPDHLTYNWQHVTTKEWTKSKCKTVVQWLIVVVLVGVDFCYGGSAGYGYETTVAANALCGEDQADDVCVDGYCYIGTKYCQLGDPSSCGTCSTDADCRCSPDQIHMPPIDPAGGEYGNLKAPLRRMGYVQGSVFGLGTMFLEITGWASIYIAKAGITAHLDLVKAKAPIFTGTLVWATQSLGKFLAHRIAATLKISIELNFLSGYVLAWAKLLLPYFCWKTIEIPWLCCSKWSCSFCRKKIKIPWLCFRWEEIFRAVLAEWSGIFKEYTIWEQPLVDESITITPPGGE